MPTVSVILPTHNRCRTLPGAIGSVLSQSFHDLELIVVDDASSEDVEGLVAGINDARLVYVRREKNGGAGAARNTGLSVARAGYIAFQDSDDLWLPGKLEAQLGLFARLPPDVGAVTGRKIVYAAAGRPILGLAQAQAAQVAIAPAGRPMTLEQDQFARMLGDNRLSVQCALFKRSQLPPGDWFDTAASANEDWEFAVRLARQTRLYEDAQPVAIGFVSTDSISTNVRRQTIGEIRILKKNRVALAGYRAQRSGLLLDIARTLFKTGKRRLGMRFLLASLADHPSNTMSLLAASRRAAMRSVRLAWQGGG